MDKIIIKDLEIYANHGVLKEERELGQKFVVSCVLYLDTRKAASDDDINQTIDYGKICFRITRFLTEHTYKLIETAAEEMVKELLYTIPAIEKIDFDLYKPWAPIGLPLSNVGVSISRGWHDAVIALGSNMGDREAYLKHGVNSIENSKDCRLTDTVYTGFLGQGLWIWCIAVLCHDITAHIKKCLCGSCFTVRVIPAVCNFNIYNSIRIN